MINLLKMNLFYLVKTKALYITSLLMIVFLIISGVGDRIIHEELNNSPELSQFVESNVSSSNLTNIGISVSLTQAVSITDSVIQNFTGGISLLFLLILVVLFSLSDFTSGFIKCFSGQLSHRHLLVTSKAAVTAIVTLYMLLLYTIIQAVICKLSYPDLPFGNLVELLKVFLIQYVLHFGTAVIVMALSSIIRSQAASIVTCILIAVNIQSLIYQLINLIISKLAPDSTFNVFSYTLLGNIRTVSASMSDSDVIRCIVVSLIFTAVGIFTGSLFTERKDII